MKMNFYGLKGTGLERILIVLVVFIAVTVVKMQVLPVNPVNDPLQPAAVPVTVIEHSGAAGETAPVLQKYVVTFQLKNYSLLPMARVLVNDEPQKIFNDRYVTVFVRAGDILKIDGTRYNRSIDIEVLDVSKEVIRPAAGSGFRVEGNVVTVGKVCLSEAGK